MKQFPGVQNYGGGGGGGYWGGANDRGKMIGGKMIREWENSVHQKISRGQNDRGQIDMGAK